MREVKRKFKVKLIKQNKMVYIGMFFKGNYGVFDESTQDVNSGQVVQMRRLTNDSTNTVYY